MDFSRAALWGGGLFLVASVVFRFLPRSAEEPHGAGPAAAPVVDQSPVPAVAEVADPALVGELAAFARGPDWANGPAWRGFVVGLEPARVPAVLAAVEAQRDTEVRIRMRQAVLRRWGQFEPERALRYAQGLPYSEGAQLPSVASVVSGWYQADPEGALEWFHRQPEGPVRFVAEQALLRSLGREDPRLALDLLLAGPDGNPQRGSLFAEVFRELAARNPTEAFSLLERVPTEIRRRSARLGMVQGWLKRDEAAALAWVGTLPNGDERTHLRDVAFGRVAERDPRRALELAQMEPAGHGRSALISSICFNWSGRDAADFDRWCAALPEGALKDAAQRVTFFRLAQQDRAAAYRYLEGVPALAADQSLRNSHLTSWSQHDPAAALAAIRRLPPGTDRIDQQSFALGQLAKSDPAAAVQIVGALPAGMERNWAATRLVSTLAQHDPEMAGQLAGLLPPGESSEAALRAVASGFISHDLPGGLAWVQTLPEGRGKQQAVRALALELARTDPAAAGEFAGRFPAGEWRDETFGRIAYAWAANDPQGALRWAQQLGEPSLRSLAVENACGHWSQREPAAALAFIRTYPDSGLCERLTFGILQAWAMRDPATAEAWAAVNPEGRTARATWGLVTGMAESDPQRAASTAAGQSDPDLRDELLGRVVARWVVVDSASARTWLAAQPRGAVRQAALEPFVVAAADVSPALAAEFAGEIADREQRHAAIAAIARQWLAVDPAGAEAWLARTDLAPEAKQRLLTR